MSTWFRRFLALMAVASFPAAVMAQSEARMTGAVLDHAGAAVPKANVRLEPTDDRGVAVESKTKKDGRFLIGMIRPGGYRLVVAASGDQVLLHIKGRVVDGTDKRVLWETDRDVSADSQPTISVGALNQITVDLVVGPTSLTPESKQATSQAAQSAYAEGANLIRAGDFAGGLAKLEPLLAEAADQVGVIYLVAFAKHQLGRDKEALADLDKVIAKQPDYSGAHVLRGKILQDEGRNDDAEAEFRRELAGSTDKSVRMESWIALAVLFEKSNRLPRAIETLEQAVNEEPRRELLLALADFYAKSGDREKAAATLERADKEAGGMDDVAMLNLAISYINDKNYDQAERLALRIVEKDSTNQNKSLGHSVLARCDLSRNNISGGIEHLEKALALDPKSSLAEENREILGALKKK
jgi:tetratricopeptide (TPR) repeat protein